jgi:ABC-type antimicrobial peptide transport system permease subunit
VLAVVGIYGVVSYSVAQRRREMGIRMALGAQPGSLLSLVMRHGVWMALFGIILGVVAARLLGRFAESMLFGVTPSDPLPMEASRCCSRWSLWRRRSFPARRATRVDPALGVALGVMDTDL